MKFTKRENSIAINILRHEGLLEMQKYILGLVNKKRRRTKPTPLAPDSADAESEKRFDYGASLGIVNADDEPPSG